MKSKLKLNLEDLTVASFDTTRSETPKGTVFGEQCTCYTNCTCPGCPSCDATCTEIDSASCYGTCVASCYGTYECGTDSCNISCNETNCAQAYTCGYCTAHGTNCDQICV